MPDANGELKQWIGRFLDWLSVEKGYSPNTVLSYGYDLERYREFIEDTLFINIALVQAFNIREYLFHLKSRGLSTRSMERHLAAVKQFHRFLCREGYLENDCTSNLDRFKVWKLLPETLSVQEVDRLLAQPNLADRRGVRDAAMLELMYSAGLRISELIGLRRDDVFFDVRFIKCSGKGGKERLIPIGEIAVQKLRKYLEIEMNPTAEHLFLTRMGRPFARSGCWKMIHDYIKRISPKKRVTPHTLRHSFATHLLAGGANLRSIQEMLGHADIATTQIYTHVTTDKLRQTHLRCHPRG